MNQAFNAFFKSDEDAVVHYIDDNALDFHADRITCFDIFPRACVLLLEAERNFFVILINADNNAFDFLVDMNDF